MSSVSFESLVLIEVLSAEDFPTGIR